MAKSVFLHAALASGLLTQDDLDEAVEVLRAEDRRPFKLIGDERLAKKLVAMGRLNLWQAEQLRGGRTSFTLGNYELIDFLGRGGMGEVYKARHLVMRREVAIKVLPKNKCTPEAIASFHREIRTQAQLDHENLVRAYDAGHDKNVHFLVTEYVPGPDLRKLIRRQRGHLSMQAAASVIAQAAKGLGYAHSRGLIHRDVKPGNLLVTPDGHTKVSDLGLADFFHDAEQTDVHGGKVVGTADYLAPEQITAPDKPQSVSDIYALGCTLYYAVTGKVPFPGGKAPDKARAHINDLPIDPRRLNEELSDPFVEVIADMMAKKVGERVPTAAGVIERLSPWLEATPPAYLQTVQSVSVSAPITIDTRVERPVVPSISDTEPNFVFPPGDDPGGGDSPSQMSLGTQPMATNSQETIPLFGPDYDRIAWPPNAYFNNLPTWVRVLIAVGIMSAVAAFAAVIGLITYDHM